MQSTQRCTWIYLVVLAGLQLSSDSQIGNADDRPMRPELKSSKWQPTHPKWSEMQALLGKPIDSKEVLSFTKRYRLKRYAKSTSGGFSNSSEVPFSLLWRKFRITRIVVNISTLRRRPVYRGKLPNGVKSTDTPEDVIRRVGRPSHHPYRDYVHYEKLGLTFAFSRDTHRLREIDIDVPKKPSAKSQSK